MVNMVAAANGDEHAVALGNIPEADAQLLQAGVAGRQPASETSSLSTMKRNKAPTGTPAYTDEGVEQSENPHDSDDDSLTSATEVELHSVLGANLSNPTRARAFRASWENQHPGSRPQPLRKMAHGPKS